MLGIKKFEDSLNIPVNKVFLHDAEFSEIGITDLSMLFFDIFRGTVIGLTSVFPHVAAFVVEFFVRIHCIQSLYVTSGLIMGELCIIIRKY